MIKKTNNKKKKKKKGFTLIELLAIIVILAIIMVVTIPTVLGSVANARRKSFQNSVDIAADWIEKQQKLALIDKKMVNPSYLDLCSFPAAGTFCTKEDGYTYEMIAGSAGLDNFFKETGIIYDGLNSLKLEKNNINGKICLKAFIKKTSDFGDLKPKIGETNNGKDGIYYDDRNSNGKYDESEQFYMQSSGCSGTIEPTISTSYVLKNSNEVSSADDPFLGIQDIPRNQIRSIEFINTSNAPENSIGTYDVSLINDNSVLLYYTDSGYTDTLGNMLYDIRIGTDTGTTIASSGSYLFSYLTLRTTQPQTIDINLTNLDTSKVTDMSYMFSNSSLTSLDFSNFDTSQVIDMSYMFEFISNITLDLTNFNTSNVINMSGMFHGANLTTLDLSSFNTSNVTNMSGMFWFNPSLTTLNLSDFNTSKVTDMSSMFKGDRSLTALDLSSFNTLNVTNMRDMFYDCPNLKTIYTTNAFATTKASDSAYMFSQCTSLVGGNGTTFDSTKIDKTYAKIDGGISNPGYFTLKK